MKYKEYMDKIEISEEMKSRILSNIEEFEKKSNSNNKSDKIVRPFFKKKVYKGLALEKTPPSEQVTPPSTREPRSNEPGGYIETQMEIG